MVARKKSSHSKKRVLSPEQIAKMQEGRKRAKVHRARMSALNEAHLVDESGPGWTEKMLNSVRRKG